MDNRRPSARREVNRRESAEDADGADDALHSREPDEHGKRPRDPGSMIGSEAKEGVDDNRLEPFGQAADETQGPLVTDGKPAPLGERREGQERRPGDIVGAEQYDARQTRVRPGDRDPGDEPAINGEIADQIEEPAALTRLTESRDRTVQTVEDATDEPQSERNPPVGERRPKARANSRRERRRRQRPGGHPEPRNPMRYRVVERSDMRPQERVEHPSHPPGRGWIPAALTIALVLFGGLVGAAVQSIEPDTLVGGHVSLSAWQAVLGDRDFAAALAFTLETSAAATALAVICGVALAALVRPCAPRVQALVTLPVAVPHLVIAIAAVAWLGAGGIVDRAVTLPTQLVGDTRGIGIVLVYVLKEAPFVALAALAVWGEETRGREEAARVLGAGPVARLVLVVVPQLRPAVIASALAVSAFALGSFEVALIVGPTYPGTLATYALNATLSPDPAAPARAAAALLVATLLALFAAVLAGQTLRRRSA